MNLEKNHDLEIAKYFENCSKDFDWNIRMSSPQYGISKMRNRCFSHLCPYQCLTTAKNYENPEEKFEEKPIIINHGNNPTESTLKTVRHPKEFQIKYFFPFFDRSVLFFLQILRNMIFINEYLCNFKQRTKSSYHIKLRPPPS